LRWEKRIRYLEAKWEGIEMTKYEIRFGLVRVSNEEFRTVEYFRITPELLRSLVPVAELQSPLVVVSADRDALKRRSLHLTPLLY